MSPRRPLPHAFTVLELLVVLTIIGVLASMSMPVFRGIAERGRTVACASNLRQLWAAVQSSAADNDNTFPEIKMSPTDASADPEALELKETLARYGIDDPVLKCPADIAGPNLFATMRTSYLWIPIVEDENTTAVKMYRRRRVISAKPSRVPILQDFSTVHPAGASGGKKTMNTVYLDGHIKQS